MTHSLTLDHPVIYRTSAVLHWLGVLSVVASRFVPTALVLMCLATGAACFAFGGILAWYHVRARVRVVNELHAASDLAKTMRLHLMMIHDMDVHKPSTTCHCCPTEAKPGLWVHHQPNGKNCLADLEAASDQWTSLREEYTTKP